MIVPKLIAFFQHGFYLARAYKLNLAARYLTTFITVVFYYFLAHLFNRYGVVVAPGVDYFTFVLIGGSFARYVDIGMRILPDALREEMLMGTLEPLLVTATPTTLALIGPAMFLVVEGTLLVLVQLLTGGLFGADFSRANWPSAVFMTGLMVGALFCWGMVAAAFVMRYKRNDPFNWIVGAISYVFSGVYFPVSTLPPALQVISYLLPFTYGLQGLRGALLRGLSPIELWPEVLALSIFTAVGLPLAIFSLRSATRHLKRSGELGYY